MALNDKINDQLDELTGRVGLAWPGPSGKKTPVTAHALDVVIGLMRLINDQRETGEPVPLQRLLDLTKGATAVAEDIKRIESRGVNVAEMLTAGIGKLWSAIAPDLSLQKLPQASAVDERLHNLLALSRRNHTAALQELVALTRHMAELSRKTADETELHQMSLAEAATMLAACGTDDSAEIDVDAAFRDESAAEIAVDVDVEDGPASNSPIENDTFGVPEEVDGIDHLFNDDGF